MSAKVYKYVIFVRCNMVYLAKFFIIIIVECCNISDCSIFTNKREALQNVKKIPGSRFKIFTNIEEARIFSRLDPNTIPPSPKPMKTKAANVRIPADMYANCKALPGMDMMDHTFECSHDMLPRAKQVTKNVHIAFEERG